MTRIPEASLSVKKTSEIEMQIKGSQFYPSQT